jgi:transcriptional regulator with XRE-family HTH domain
MMTRGERMQLLEKVCQEHSQAEVARRIGYRDSTISQILNDKYHGSPDIVLQRVEEVFGDTMIDCPVLGIITLGKCAEKRKLPFAATNPRRVELYCACKECGGRGRV